MKVCDKVACSFSNWYPNYRRVTFKSEYIMIPPDVLSYLKNDIVMVPTEAVLDIKKTSEVDDVTYSIWESDGEDDDESVPPPSFPEFSNQLKTCMEKLGGSVFVKLNWSAPLDASWIATNNSLKCTNLQDIYLLIKGSNRVSLDLEYGGKDFEFHVVLRKWEDIHPGSEFRCFVSNGDLIAITQRDKSEYHNHIPLQKCNIVEDIKNFFESHIKKNFILLNYIVDVIWNMSTVKIVDFNTFDERDNDSYLFEWSELKAMSYIEGVSPEFRFIGEEVGIQPANLDHHFGLPSDLTSLSEDSTRSLIEMIQNNIDLQSNDKE